MKIRLGTANDLAGWMDLVSRVKEDFPGLETAEALEEHRKVVLEFVNHGSAICAERDHKIVGALLFSSEHHMLCFLAVDPAHRRQHIAETMVSQMLTRMDPTRDITVTTYREGVPEVIAARAFYRRLGFAEGRLTEEFGSPVQEFVLNRSGLAPAGSPDFP